MTSFGTVVQSELSILRVCEWASSLPLRHFFTEKKIRDFATCSIVSHQSWESSSKSRAARVFEVFFAKFAFFHFLSREEKKTLWRHYYSLLSRAVCLKGALFTSVFFQSVRAQKLQKLAKNDVARKVRERTTFFSIKDFESERRKNGKSRWFVRPLIVLL